MLPWIALVALTLGTIVVIGLKARRDMLDYEDFLNKLKERKKE